MSIHNLIDIKYILDVSFVEFYRLLISSITYVVLKLSMRKGNKYKWYNMREGLQNTTLGRNMFKEVKLIN